MRVLALVLLISTVVLGLDALAGSDDGKPATDKRLDALELEVGYLRSREAQLSSYMLRNADRAAALEGLVTKMRSEGFTKRAIPVSSRESLLAGLSSLAKDLQHELPALTDKEQVQLKKLAALRK